MVPEPPSDLRENLTVEGRPVRIIGRKTKPESRKNIKMIQVVWDCDGEEETTWEPEARMKAEFPKWFDKLTEDSGRKTRGRVGAKWGRTYSDRVLKIDVRMI